MGWICCDVKDMEGKNLVSVRGLEVGSDEVIFSTECGERYRMLHHQDCCEFVVIEDLEGDTTDLEGGLVVIAEEVSSDDTELPSGHESCTWTFYKIETNIGGVWIRWLGSSNGYYSEGVDFEKYVKQ
jgi:hypothetical protein